MPIRHKTVLAKYAVCISGKQVTSLKFVLLFYCQYFPRWFMSFQDCSWHDRFSGCWYHEKL